MSIIVVLVGVAISIILNDIMATVIANTIALIMVIWRCNYLQAQLDRKQTKVHYDTEI